MNCSTLIDLNQGGIKFKLYLTTELTLFIFFFTQGGPVSEFSNEPSPYPKDVISKVVLFICN